jgi:pimeloyl-ACP methyl ester carboxylesterase
MDIKLHYEEAGDANALPLILLHGNGESGAYFKNQIPHFSGRFRVIAIDTRGHGRSPRGAAPFTIKQFAEDLNEFMEEKGIACAVVLGFSDGANIAMEFALNHPEKLKALILNGGNLNTSGVKRSVQIPIEIGYRMAKHFAGKSPKAKANAEMLGLMVNQPNISPEELSRIAVPTLVICGTNDMIKNSHSRLITKSIPNAKFSAVKGDHFIAGKEPEAFNREVDVFLDSIEL